MEENEARFFIDLVIEAELERELDYDKKDSVEYILAKELIKKRIDRYFDISEISYDHYNRKEVMRADFLLWKLTEARNLLLKD